LHPAEIRYHVPAKILLLITGKNTMPVLHNLASNKELKARMLAETEPRTTVSFYKYFQIADLKAFRDALYVGLTAFKVFGCVYVAHEGINAQISVPAS